MKKLILNIFLVISFFVGGILWANADATTATTPADTRQCVADNNCFDRSDFQINVGEFTPGGKDFIWQGSGKETLNLFLWTIVRRLMVALWIVSLFIMTIGAWFMITYGGNDSNLTKGKAILKAGLVSLFVALSSYTIITILTFILYH
jgi:hypothetical protein